MKKQDDFELIDSNSHPSEAPTSTDRKPGPTIKVGYSLGRHVPDVEFEFYKNRQDELMVSCRQDVNLSTLFAFLFNQLK